MPAVTYKATRTLSIYRKIQCEACDQVFDYIATEKFQSEHTATSIFTQGLAEKQTQEDVQKAYDQRVKVLTAQGNAAVIKVEPCPSCGYYQSYMVTARQQEAHLFIFGGIVLPLVGLWMSTFETDATTLKYIFSFFLGGVGVIILSMGVYSLANPLNQKWLKEHGKTKRDVPPPRKPLETRILY